MCTLTSNMYERLESNTCMQPRCNNNHDVCIPFVMANFILCYTCLLCTVCDYLVGGVDVCNADCPLFVCACLE